MLKVFQVHLAEGCDGSGILSDEMKAETSAQIMTAEEALAVGFAGVPTDKPELRFIAVTPRDERWVQQALERSPEVDEFCVHDIAT